MHSKKQFIVKQIRPYLYTSQGAFNPAPWTTHLGGVLTQYTIPNPVDDNHKHALKLGERTSAHDGPKHPIDLNCFVTDRVVEVRAKIKMTQELTGDDGAIAEVPYGCDPHARSASTCPILTVEVIYETGSEHKYSPNDAVFEWKADEFNDFHAFFQITEDMTLATEASFYFERPPPGVNIIIDDVEIEEFQPVPIGNIHEEGDDNVYPYCDEIVTNGNAEVSLIRSSICDSLLVSLLTIIWNDKCFRLRPETLLAGLHA